MFNDYLPPLSVRFELWRFDREMEEMELILGECARTLAAREWRENVTSMDFARKWSEEWR